MRRAIVIFALLLGFLGPLQSVLACASTTAAHHCCPAGSNMPCDKDPVQHTVMPDLQICCASMPMSEPAQVISIGAFVEAPASVHIPAVASGLPLSQPPPDPGSHATTEIYLRTLRLRL
jgi:hypothetical protein